jgi:hypothetical protein
VGRFGSDAFAAQNRAKNNPQPEWFLSID